MDESVTDGPGGESTEVGPVGSSTVAADPAVARSIGIRPIVRTASGRRGRPRTGWESLTPTEWEVIGQVAAGLSNAQIGERLLVSAGTVRTHLRSVFTKLGVTSRTELASRAIADRSVSGTAAPAGCGPFLSGASVTLPETVSPTVSEEPDAHARPRHRVHLRHRRAGEQPA